MVDGYRPLEEGDERVVSRVTPSREATRHPFDRTEVRAAFMMEIEGGFGILFGGYI